MWAQSKQAWSQLAEREQTLLKGLALFLAVTVLYLVIWSPIHSAYHNAQQSEQRAQQAWQWLHDQVLANPATEGANDTLRFSTQSELMSTLQSTLRSENLLSSMQAMTPATKSIKVDFKAADAPRFFSWLSLLEKRGLVSSQLQVNAISTGIIEVSVRFEVAK